MEQDDNLSRRERIKAHWNRNKEVYVSFSFGVLVTLVFVQRPIRIINTVAPVFHNKNMQPVFLGGHLIKIVRNDQTGEVIEGVNELARSLGKPMDMVSKHLNRYPGYDQLDGHTWTIIGVGT